MKVYRTAAGTWVNTQVEWKEKTREEGGDAKGTPEPIEVPINPKSALVGFLNGLGAEAPHVAPVEPVSISQPDTTIPPAHVSLDEQVRAAPLRARLGWAVEAIDAAESMLGKMSAALKGRTG